MSLVPTPPVETGLTPVQRPRSLQPATVYLAGLGSGSRRTMRQALESIVRLVSGGQSDIESLPWEPLHYQHTQAIRSALIEQLSVASTNKQLSALRGVLQEAWRLGLMSAEDYHRATDIKNFRAMVKTCG
jgi:integrase/recombinase XerC